MRANVRSDQGASGMRPAREPCVALWEGSMR